MKKELQAFRSKSEQIIAQILMKYGIRYEYEKQIRVNEIQGNNKLESLWYPDFFLTDYNIFVELIGKPEDRGYMEGFEKKKNIFKNENIPVLFVFPHEIWNFRGEKPKQKKEFEFGVIISILLHPKTNS
ncbi:hypothetical protein J4456_01175 [Candidatus Pacearchaeota archaeon]|nr:hypothetical protein [Candidatus Pacearchaeota archaeon]